MDKTKVSAQTYFNRTCLTGTVKLTTTDTTPDNYSIVLQYYNTVIEYISTSIIYLINRFF